MSTLRVTNLQSAAGTQNVTQDRLYRGAATAWVSFNGGGTTSTNQTIRDSYNVSSVFKNGTGDFTVNFASALANANYSVTGSSTSQASTALNALYAADSATVRSISSFRIFTSCWTTGPVAQDPPYCSIAIFGGY